MMPVVATIATVCRVFATLHMNVITISRPFLSRSSWYSPQSVRFAIRLLRSTWFSPKSQEPVSCVYYVLCDCHSRDNRLCHMFVALQLVVTAVIVGFVRCSSCRRSVYSKLFSRRLLSASKNNHRSLYPCLPKYSARMIGVQKLKMYISELTLGSHGYIPVAYIAVQYMIWP